MSVLIKGMELPAECRECKMLTYYSTSGCSMCDITGNALARNFKPIPFDERPDWCPLIEIPEPHGDLIDRDAPEIVFCKDCRKHNVKVGFDENFHTVWKEDACPLVDWRGKAKEHEFDYQYCAFAERRTDD